MFKDIMRIGPAPTIKRELMCALVMAIAIGIFCYWVNNSDKPLLGYAVAALMGLYVIGRVVVRVVQGDSVDEG